MNLLATGTLVLCILLLSGISTTAFATPVKLGKESVYQLAGHLEILVDPGSKLTLADILSAQTSKRFTPIPGNLNRGYSRDTNWLRFTVIRTSPLFDEAWLRLGPPYLDSVIVYQQTGSDPTLPASYLEYRLGDHVPVAERTVLHPEFVIPLHLSPEKPLTFIIRLNTTSTHHLEGTILRTVIVCVFVGWAKRSVPNRVGVNVGHGKKPPLPNLLCINAQFIAVLSIFTAPVTCSATTPSISYSRVDISVLPWSLP